MKKESTYKPSSDGASLEWPLDRRAFSEGSGRRHRYPLSGQARFPRRSGPNAPGSLFHRFQRLSSKSVKTAGSCFTGKIEMGRGWSPRSPRCLPTNWMYRWSRSDGHGRYRPLPWDMGPSGR